MSAWSACIRIGEPKVASVVSYPEACEARLPWRISRCSREQLCFITWPRRHGGDCSAVALTAVEPSLARAGLRRPEGLSTATGSSDATDFSARRRYNRAAVAPPRQPPLPALSHGIAIAASQNRRDDYYYGGARPITMAVRPTMAATPITAVSLLWRRIWLSQVQRPLFQRSSGRRLVIAAIPNRLIRRLLGCGVGFFSFCDNW